MSTTEVPEGTVQDVLAWVGDDPERAQAALDAERDGQNRSTLIGQLESTASKEAAVTEDTSTVEETEDEIPAPEPPRDVALFAGDHGTTILPIHVRDADVDVEDSSLEADIEAERDDTLIEGEQVEFVTGAVASNGAAISINGNVFLFNGQMVGALKQVIDKAVVGLSL